MVKKIVSSHQVNSVEQHFEELKLADPRIAE